MGSPRITSYTVTTALGKGGFGEVFAAVHDVLGREVAIKVLHQRWSNDEEAVHRFVAEARAVNAVRHPNIVDVVDFGTLEDGRHYHVMERLRGESLHARMVNRGPMSLEEALPILRAMAGALDVVHDAGIVHRDVKPENVFLHDEAGREIVKLIDFGLAKLVATPAAGPTQTGVILGTPAYMSPEQCRAQPVERQSDIYAFGVIAYEILTGGVPHRGADPVATLLAHVHDEPERPSRRRPALPRELDDVILGLLAKSPRARPARLAPVVDRLAEIAEGPPARRSHRAGWIVGGALALAAGVVGVAVFGSTHAAEPAPGPSPANDRATRAPTTPAPDAAPSTGTTPPDAGTPQVSAPPLRPSRRNPEEVEDPYPK
jgi:serine/threonine-protein kinase